MRALGRMTPLAGAALALVACATARPPERVAPPAKPPLAMRGYSVCSPAGDGWAVRADEEADRVRFDYPIRFQQMFRPFRVGFAEVEVTRFRVAEAECAAGEDAMAGHFRDAALLALLAAERDDRGRCQLAGFTGARELLGSRRVHVIRYQYECRAEHGEMGLDAEAYLRFPADFAQGRAFDAVFAAHTYRHTGPAGHTARVDAARIRLVLASLDPR